MHATDTPWKVDGVVSLLPGKCDPRMSPIPAAGGPDVPTSPVHVSELDAWDEDRVRQWARDVAGECACVTLNECMFYCSVLCTDSCLTRVFRGRRVATMPDWEAVDDPRGP